MIGGGLLGLEAARGLQSHGIARRRRALRRAPDERPARPPTAARCCGAASRAARHRGRHTAPGPPRSWASDKVRGVRLAGPAEIACDLVVVAAGIRPNAEVAVDQRPAGRAGHRGRRPDADQRRATTSTRSASASSTAARCTAWSHRCGSRPWCWPTTSPAPTRTPPTWARGPPPSSRWPASTSPRWGCRRRSATPTSTCVFSEPSTGVFKSIVIRDGKIVGATLLGDSRKVAFLMQAFDRGLPLPEERVELLFDLGGPAEEVGVAELADDAQVCNCNGVSKGAIVDTVEGRLQDGRRRDGRDPGRQGLRLLQGAGRSRWSSGPRTARWRRTRRPLLRARHPDGQAGADGGDPRAAACRSRRRRCSPRWPRAAPRTPSRKMGLASLLKMMWGERLRRRARRPVHQRPGPRQHPEGRHLLGGAADARRRHHARRSCAGSPTSPRSTTCRWSSSPAASGSTCSASRRRTCRRSGPTSDMPSGYAYGKSFRTVKTCVGQEFCRFGTGDSTKLGIEIEKRFQGIESPAKMKLAVSGCPRNCAESLRQGRRRRGHRGRPLGDLRRRRGRRPHPQGRPAGHRGLTAETVTLLTGRFLQYYRENANWLERTYAFVPRVGHRADPGRRRRGRRGHRRRAGRRDAGVSATLRRPVAGAGRAGHPRPVPHRRCRWRCCPRCRCRMSVRCW